MSRRNIISRGIPGLKRNELMTTNVIKFDMLGIMRHVPKA